MDGMIGESVEVRIVWLRVVLYGVIGDIGMDVVERVVVGVDGVIGESGRGGMGVVCVGCKCGCVVSG